MSIQSAPTLSDDCPIDLERLLETRMLVQARSGAGKSHLLRRLIEQTHGQVQQIVIDPEGEFDTLREKFDFVICAPEGGDVVATPATARMLARKLLETHLSAVVNIYDLKPHHRLEFVRLFCDELINAKRALWHSVLIVIDEAHIFCPQDGKSESAGAIIDLATRGRKRGFCLCLATQRLSKLHKDAAAEMGNKLIGGTGLDIDVKRALDEIGWRSAENAAYIRALPAGGFLAFGPALSNTVRKIFVGPVTTVHPKSGSRLLTSPPPPSAKIKAMLAEGLRDLPQEAEKEAKSLEELREKNRELKGTVAHLLNQGKTTEWITREEYAERIQEARREALEEAGAIFEKGMGQYVMGARKTLETALEFFGGANIPWKSQFKNFEGLFFDEKEKKIFLSTANRIQDVPATLDRVYEIPFPAKKEADVTQPSHDNPEVPKGARRLLGELVSRMPAGYTKSQVATLAGFAPSGGTFGNYLSILRKHGCIQENNGLIYATAAGARGMGGEVPKAPTTAAECLARWKTAIPSGAFKMLEVIVGHETIGRDILAKLVGMEKTGGTFGNYLSILNRNGLIEKVGKDVFKPAGILAGE